MYSLLFLAAASLLSALVLTPIVRNLALQRRWVDKSDAARKVHVGPIPRVGGVAILLSFGISLIALAFLPSGAATKIERGVSLAGRLFPAIILVFVTGLIDDIRDIRPRYKLLGLIAGAVLAWSAGVRLSSIGGIPLNEYFILPLTLLWLVGCANAFNLIDGVDGLASGAGLFATLTVTVAALLSGNYNLALVTVPLAGAILGFLRYNFNPASIFLGDSGSLLIGFLLGCFGLLWSQKSATLLGMTAPLMALALPLMDTGIAILRRYLSDKPVFGADRGHIHHRLLDRGLSPRGVALILYGVCGLGAAFSLLMEFGNGNFDGLVLVLFCAAAWIGVQHLGYIEFGEARRMFLQGAFRKMINAQLCLRRFRDRLREADTPEELWLVVEAATTEFGFAHARFQWNGHVFETHLLPGGDVQGAPSWEIRIPIHGNNYLNLSRPISGAALPTVTSTFVETAWTVLRDKADVEGTSITSELGRTGAIIAAAQSRRG